MTTLNIALYAMLLLIKQINIIVIFEGVHTCSILHVVHTTSHYVAYMSSLLLKPIINNNKI